MSSKHFQDMALHDLTLIIDDELIDLEKWSTDNNDIHLDQIATFIQSWEILKQILSEEQV